MCYGAAPFPRKMFQRTFWTRLRTARFSTQCATPTVSCKSPQSPNTLAQAHTHPSHSYTVPGFNGSLKDGEREINWAQYTWPARSLIQDILTDTDGHQHRTTLPKGKMRPEIWQKQMEHARRMFHPELVELAEKIKEPFVSVISSTSYPRAAYFNNRLFFIGDALAQKQPNTAQGTNLAAMDAMSLANMVAAKMSPQEWEERVLETAERERLGSIAFASQRLCTWWGMALNEVRYRWLIQRPGAG